MAETPREKLIRRFNPDAPANSQYHVPPEPESAKRHYGLEFLDALKAAGMYGDVFTYEEYQELKKARTRSEFETFWENTVYCDLPVHPCPSDTWLEYELYLEWLQIYDETMRATERACRAGDAGIPGCSLFGSLIDRLMRPSRIRVYRERMIAYDEKLETHRDQAAQKTWQGEE